MKRQSGRCSKPVFALVVVLIAAAFLGLFKMLYSEVDVTQIATFSLVMALVVAGIVCWLVNRRAGSGRPEQADE